jgi:hypothetical protein
MSKLANALSLVLIFAIMSSGLAIIQSAAAQSIPKPSIPDFTVQYVDRSYYVAPVYGVDPYSGKTVQTGGGFTITNKTLEVTIFSQSFTPYVFTGEDGLPHEPSMMWDIAYKGHFGEDWTITAAQGPYWNESSMVTVFGLGPEHQNLPMYLPAGLGDQVDFKVRARIGYNSLKEGHSFTDPDAFEFHGETSDWSSVKTFTIGENAGAKTVNPTPNPTTTKSSTPTPITILMPTSAPTATETNSNPTDSVSLPLTGFVAIIAVIVFLAVALLVLVLRRKPKP